MRYVACAEGPPQESWKRGKEIRIIKDEKAEGYTFIGDRIDLPAEGEGAAGNGKRKERDFTLRSHPKDTKARARSRLTGGHSKQGHSPVYE